MAKSNETGLVPVEDNDSEDQSTGEAQASPDEVTKEPAKPAALEAKSPRGLKGLWYKLTGTRKRATYSAIGAVVIIAAIIGFTPLKYTMLGWAVKSSLDVRVTDGDTGQLLPGAVVKLAGVTVTTDKTGIAHFAKVHPGSTSLSIAKPAYEGWLAKFTLGFGNQGTRQAILTSTGVKITFKLTDYVSGKAVSGARVQLADADAVSGADGTVVDSVTPDNEGQSVTATVTADGYNTLTMPVSVNVGLATIAAKLVPSGQVYFLSNRTGTIDLYGANLDGSNVVDLLPGTGKEDTSTGILPNVYDQSVVALVSSRAGHLINGNPQEDLYLFQPSSKTLTLIDSNISFYSYRTWLGKVLIYQKNNSSGNSIQAYDWGTGKNTTIVTCTGDKACPQPLYATDDYFFYSLYGAPLSSNAVGVFAVKVGTTTPQSISSIPASGAVRQTQAAVLLNYYGVTQAYPSGNAWQSVDLGTIKTTTIAAPSNTTSTSTFVNSPGDKLSASIQTRDGQTDVYVTGLDGSDARQLTTTGNVSQFVQWFGDNLIVYSAANQLFVVGTNGGTPHKITNFYSGTVQSYAGGYNPNY